MANVVVNGALLQCSMGLAPGTLTVLPSRMVNAAQQPMATIMDFAPMTNIGTFGMCQSPANPEVAAATAAAMGVLTPMPCVPATVAPWTPGSVVSQNTMFPVLLDSDQCMCAYAGQIQVSFAGQVGITSS